MAESRKIHSYANISSDLIQLSLIEKSINSKVKEFRGITESINSINREINSLKNSDNENDKKKIDVLRQNIDGKNKEYLNYNDSITKGGITEKIISELKGKASEEISQESKAKAPSDGRSSLSIIIQIMVEKRFLHEEIKNSYGRKNLDYYQEIKGVKSIADSINRL